MAEVTDEEREMLVDSARAWVRQRAPVKLVRDARTDHAAKGYDPAIFKEISEMGWTGMIVPEAFGGHDMGLECMGLLVEELGRNLTPSPLVASAVAAVSALVLGGTDQQKRRWLPPLAAGELVGTLAIEHGRGFDLNHPAVSAIRVDGQWVLKGCSQPVEAGMAADLIVVLARSGTESSGGSVLAFLCPSNTPGVGRIPLDGIDARGRAAVVFDNVQLSDDNVLGSVGSGSTLAGEILDRTAAIAAAEMLGGALQAFETTMDYLRTRVQFGKPIGSFQALQHRAADMLGEIGLARAAVYEALRALDSGDDHAALLASVAKIVAGKVFHKVAREMIQMHGGIGMTEEHDAGLYFKRAHTADIFCGNIAFHRERVARLIGI
ncbi:acyl-CoA dehydrogenase family protein [Sphingosinicella microcystinivorans]|uniref:acyl-CoA dehydrogenase family protein n=1 Tax=Sphingosinicella microcystinivorans TaxID=335406 RepID=UPI0022F3D980|nr:acyl-CoA dehydrogenase family protein [Sphingosinicella microcystinivorans]WBX83767.1 acyl-CoA/acyl-ACP dehydrogenase [Sphingosinicella microcystinivorans]